MPEIGIGSTVCPKHKTLLKVDLVQTGGCDGHSDVRYCDARDMHVELYCDWGWCRYRVRIVEELTDTAGITRWIQARLAVPICEVPTKDEAPKGLTGENL